MKFECTASAITTAVGIVSRGVSRTTGSVLENILMRATDTGIELIASDGMVMVRSEVDAVIKEEGSVLVPGKLFNEVCRKLPEGNVTFAEKNGGMSIVSSRNRSSMRCIDSEYVDVSEIYTLLDKPGLHIGQSRLKTMIGKVSFAVAQDESRPILTGILMEVNAKELRLVALNGFCVALQVYHGDFVLPDGKQSINVIIPGHVMNEIKNILSDDETAICTFHIDGTRMLCRVGCTSIVCGLISGQYIAYRSLIPAAWISRTTVNVAELRQALDRAQLFASMNSNNRVQLFLIENGIRIVANSEGGDNEEELEGIREGKDMEIAFNARFISDVIRNISDECCTLCINTELGPCVFAPTEGDDYLYLLAALRPR